MKAFLVMVMMAGCAWGQLTVGTSDIWPLKKGNIVVTNVTLAGVVWTNDASYTATVAKAGSALQPSDTNGWTVSAHQAWITNRQNSVTLTNFTANGYFRVPSGMIYQHPGVGEFGSDYRRFGFDNSTFLFYDYIGFPDLYIGTFRIDPRDQSITYGSGLSAGRWLFPAESMTNTVASKAWVGAYVFSNAPSGPGLPAVWTNMTWGATGTNATYRMSWDVTNGTIKVEEILP
jgi:hypothetical protein